ncbi:TadE/TadG family type IV pilus assembly protein [Devosia sp. FKR38]|uniref:TadE/TadG family type IV pilus assembly protein n=1 Tax=Devosia sp. FKR38 TaxID=2562312 RepID=UPI0010C08A08|nr:TadE/TadG family type IV pilus assembly protein [Devosia sp. FKR38]
MFKLIRRLARDHRAVAATEFALVIPLLLIVFMGVVELSNYIMQSRRAHQAAIQVAEFLSRDGDNMLTVAERHVAEDIWMIVNPTAHLATTPRDDQWANGYSRAFASASFVPDPDCKIAPCSLVPKVLWSFRYEDIISNPVYTHCKLDIVDNTTALSGENIRAGLVGAAPVVVVDLTYPYFPLLQGWLFPSLELHVNAVRKMRNGVILDHVSDQFVTRC